MDFVSYTDAEGSKHEYWRILLEDFEFCERKRPKEKKEKDA
jgi:single-strand DNA-binding protein